MVLRLIEKLYVDNASNKAPDERYAKISVKFEAEQARENRHQNVEIIYNKSGAIGLDSWESKSTDTIA